jgi:hypothetical protein
MSAGASPAVFGALAEKLQGMSREARDTAGEAPALPHHQFAFQNRRLLLILSLTDANRSASL